MRVLLIEDDSATAQSIELMLKSESFNVYTTDLGEEGVDLGKLYDYDIILLDLNLPDMCCVIRIGTRCRTLPISAISPLSACGPPVDEPISRTRGATVGIGRNA